MSENKQEKCIHPELKPINGKCSAEQIQKCHGSKDHPCKPEEKEK